MEFEKLLDDTLEAFYWAGFLMADGSFHHPSNRINLEIADKEHLEKFITFLNGNPECLLKRKRPNNNNWYTSISSKLFFSNYTTRFDIKPSKTYNPPSVAHLRLSFSREQLLALLIGFIDGDGSIRFATRGAPQVALENHASWAEFHLFMIELIHELAGEPLKREYRRKNCRGYACFAIHKKALIRLLVSFIVDHNLPVLNRKWDKLKYILTAPKGRKKEITKRAPYKKRFTPTTEQ